MERSRRGLFGFKRRERDLAPAEQPQKPEWRERDDIPVPYGVITMHYPEGNEQHLVAKPYIFVDRDRGLGLSGEISSSLKGHIEDYDFISLTILPPFEDSTPDSLVQKVQDIDYYRKSSLANYAYDDNSDLKKLDELKRDRGTNKEKIKQLDDMIAYKTAMSQWSSLTRGETNKLPEELIIENYNDITLVIHDPDVRIRVSGNEELIGEPPQNIKRRIFAKSREGKVTVDYRPANKKSNEADIPEDEREMHEVLEEVEKVLDSRVDLQTLHELRVGLGKVNASELFMTHMKMLGEKIAEKEEALEKQQFGAALKLALPRHLIERGRDIIVDMAHERNLPPEDELLVRMLDNLRETYKHEAQEESGQKEVEEDTSKLLKRIKRLGRRKKELSLNEDERKLVPATEKVLDTNRFFLKRGTELGFYVTPGQNYHILEDLDDPNFYRIVGDVEELIVKEYYKVELVGNAQKVETHDDATVEVEGKVAAAVALDSSEIYASGRIKRKRQFGESVIREYDNNLETYE